MCTSETVVCFGIVMRSWQLIVAAEAFTKFSPQLRGIDIIIARHRNGALRVQEKVQKMRDISYMPLEVLEMTRGKVFSERSLEVAAREVAQVDVYHSSAGWRKIPEPHGGRDDGECECWDNHYEALFEVNLQVPLIRNSVTTLLAYYGLELASLEMGNQERHNWGVSNASTSVVALPATIEKIKIEVDHDGLSRANGVKLPPQANRFDSTPNFHRFYRDFRFDVVTEIATPPPTTPVVAATAPVAAAASPVVGTSTESSGDTVGGATSSIEKAGAVKPGWIVWTSSHSCQ